MLKHLERLKSTRRSVTGELNHLEEMRQTWNNARKLLEDVEDGVFNTCSSRGRPGGASSECPIRRRRCPGMLKHLEESQKTWRGVIRESNHLEESQGSVKTPAGASPKTQITWTSGGRALKHPEELQKTWGAPSRGFKRCREPRGTYSERLNTWRSIFAWWKHL